MNTLAVTRRLPARVEARAHAQFAVRQPTDDAPRPADEVLALCDGADALLCAPGDRLDAGLIARLPDSVRVVATFSVGMDHIDRPALAARGIALVNTPDVLNLATAELAMMLVLMAARRAGEGERAVRAGQWAGWAPTHMIATQVSGRTLGIFGMGRIGRAMAAMAAGFGMQVHYHNRQRLPREQEAGAIFHEHDDSFLAQSQVLSLNAPGGAGTKGWLDARRLALLPRGAIVVNAARGTLIDDAALIAALRAGHVAAAGLDVYDGEPRVDPGYLALENVVLLPHLGSATTTAREAMGHLALDGITGVLAGQAPSNLVPPP